MRRRLVHGTGHKKGETREREKESEREREEREQESKRARERERERDLHLAVAPLPRVARPTLEVRLALCRGSGFRVQGLGLRVWGADFGVQVSGCEFQGLGFRIWGSGFGVLKFEL